jgi:hypothetical protein
MPETITESMSAATESVKQALIGVTQDGGCKPETIALVHQAVSVWETVESEICADLKKQLAAVEARLAAALETIDKQRDENKKIEDLLELKARDVRHWREQCGKLESNRKVYQDQKALIEKQQATIEGQAQLIYNLDEEVKRRELREKREIRFGYDPNNHWFTVHFRSGQELRFDKPKSIVGNVENWLATLRHQLTE